MAAEGDIEGLLEYFVEEQYDALKAAFEKTPPTIEKYDTMRSALHEKLPAETERIDAVMDNLVEETAPLTLTVGEINVVSGELATGTIPAAILFPTVRFKLIDDEWYLEMDAFASVDQVNAIADANLIATDELIRMFQSGEITAERVLTGFEQQIETIKAQRAEAPPTDGDQPDAEDQPVAEEESEGDDPDDEEPEGEEEGG